MIFYSFFKAWRSRTDGKMDVAFRDHDFSHFIRILRFGRLGMKKKLK